ncbi:TonB-dependent receptor [Danxiaibacter flavus]|uniref:TonB-dependent receptor n=1 Tax=Danxiaibacter flavus TaxID=3049108 RepID=A0ABV3Z9B5_9BACT|nr:TonB-dependent receptor [Chitinophagaceae bacterium DXS]
MKSLQLLIVMCVIYCVPVYAQNVAAGKVLDAHTGKALAGAIVQTQNGNKSVITDNEGNFKINVPIGQMLQASHLGFTTLAFQAETYSEVRLSENVNDLSAVTVVGSRNLKRSIDNSPVPVDVIELKSATKTLPQVDLNQMLNYLAPSFNSARQSSSDGTEHIDPASLRGLGPDQTLVLINGKRRHTTSLLNNQGTFGNGSVGTDLNAIPVSAIDHIEILRDGASAQYGSDAIAGVINIVLKKNTRTFQAGVTGGVTSRGDGGTSNVNLNWGGTLGKNGGFINLTGDFLYRGKTTRTQEHNLTIFNQFALPEDAANGGAFTYDFSADPAALRAYDDSVLKARNLKRADFNFQIGDAKILNSGVFYNLSLPFKNNKAEFYSFGGFNYRDGMGFGFRRLPSEEWNMVYSIFPNGYQPNTESHIYDESVAVGLKWKYGKWNMDLSNNIGNNRFDYIVNNTVNASMKENSPTTFKAGGHAFLQNTVNLDASRYFETVAQGLNLGLGAEFRYEKYTIREGEEASWKNYGLYTQPDGTTIDTLGLSGGSQSFGGFTPYNAGTHDRSNISVYADAELDVTKSFTLAGSARFEHYSDFGSTINGKLAARYAINKVFALRGAISTGFRAPSLQQQFFSYVSTDLVNGKIGQSGFFPTNSDVAAFIGIPKLKEETSVNASAGFTVSPGKNLRITVDGYYIKVNDRITLTGNFGQDAYGNVDSVIADYLIPYGANTARFFVNSVDTKTLGVDLVTTYTYRINNNNKLDFTLAANYNNNEVVQVNSIPEKLASQPDVYFSPAERALIETINPRTKVNFTINYKVRNLTVLLRNEYFGEVTKNGFPFGEVQLHKGKTVTDIALSYDFSKHFTLSAGANNIFDIFPDRQVYSNSYFGVFKYAPVQMGTTGTFYFVRLLVSVAGKAK